MESKCKEDAFGFLTLDILNRSRMVDILDAENLSLPEALFTHLLLLDNNIFTPIIAPDRNSFRTWLKTISEFICEYSSPQDWKYQLATIVEFDMLPFIKTALYIEENQLDVFACLVTLKKAKAKKFLNAS